MSAQRKRWLLWGALVVSVLLAWLAPEDEAPADRSATPPGAGRTVQAPITQTASQDMATLAAHGSSGANGANGATGAAAMRREQLLRPARGPTAEVPDLFQSTSWYVPPPPPPPPSPPPPPPPPSAPALPFTFLGQVIEGQRVQVILARGDRVVTVAVGDNIDKNYRLESFRGGTLSFVYLPLDTVQTLVTGVSQ